MGTWAVAPQAVRLIEHVSDLDALDDLEGTPVGVAEFDSCAVGAMSHCEVRTPRDARICSGARELPYKYNADRPW